ncbi:MAG TPA: fused MFS/spermidine synthase [Vineibacter sp.]|nr:fused MFS/spermidine synthase [Vineibacter sp.]
MLLYAGTIFLSSFLLFLVQPVIAKHILPWFGGAASVWIICLVFFQFALLLGYAYADFVARRLTPRVQAILHSSLLVVSLLTLPITPDPAWKPLGDENASWRIVALLTASIGLPYFLLSSTSPLVQVWFARARPGASPYRLFALSNLASLLALFGYPIVIEPLIAARTQSWVWSGIFALYVAGCLACVWRNATASSPHVVQSAGATDDRPAPSVADYAVWTTLAAIGSVLLLAVSNHLTQNIASVPLLWVLPLGLYLISFIFSFDAAGWYRPRLYAGILAALLVGVAYVLVDPDMRLNLPVQITLFSAVLFVACMLCHTELAHLKPAPRHLTGFYLTVSLGGAIGAILVGLLAPITLKDYLELEIALVILAALVALRSRDWLVKAPLMAGFSALALVGWAHAYATFDPNNVIARNFYGVIRVVELGAPNDPDRARSLVHGTIDHGRQFLAPERQREPAGYFRHAGGIGRAMSMLPDGPRRIGIIGLGAGALAAYGRDGDVIRFYEINAAVVDFAVSRFSYMSDSRARVDTVLGDGRLALERESPQAYDLLAADAFSGDAIPVHLITAEAMTLYRRHVKPGGIIAFNVSNRFVDMAPMVAKIARAQGLHAVLCRDVDLKTGKRMSDWVLVSDDPRLADRPELRGLAQPIPDTTAAMWTDDFSNLLQVLR